MPRRPTPIVPLVSLLACAVFAWLWIDAERRSRGALSFTRPGSAATTADVSLPAPPMGLSRSDTLYWSWVAVNQQVHIKRLQAELLQRREGGTTALNDTQILELREKGMADPPRALRDSLLAHPELVPYSDYAVDRATIVVLPPGLMYAGIDDGHHFGHLLVRYQLASDGRMTWERLWSGLEPE